MRRDLVWLGIFCLVQGLFHAAWMALDARLPFWDQYRYFEMSRAAHESLAAGPGGAWLDLHASHPPLYPLLGALWMRLLGQLDFETARSLNLLLATATTLLTYGLARSWTAPRHAAVVAMLASCLPLHVSFTHLYYLENLITPVVLAGWLALLRSDHLTRLGPTIAFGVLAGAGVLVKWTVPVFLLLPALLVWWPRRSVRGLGLATLLGFLVAGPWFFTHWEGIRTFLGAGVSGGEGWLSAQTGLKGLAFYPRELLGSGLGIPAAFAAACGLLLALVRPRAEERLTLLVIGILVPLVLFSLVLTKKPRHLLPILPLLALCIGLLLERTGPRTRRILVTLLFLHLGLCAVHANFGWPEGRVRVELAGQKLPVLSTSLVPGAPDNREWPFEEILADIEAATGRPGAASEGVVLFNLNAFREVAFRYAAWQSGRDVVVRLVSHAWAADSGVHAEFPLGRHFDPKLNEWTRGLIDTDWLLAKTGTGWVRYQSRAARDAHLYGARISEALADPDGPLAAAFALRASHPLPDGTEARLYLPRPGEDARMALIRFTLRQEPGHVLAWELLGRDAPTDEEERDSILFSTLAVLTQNERDARQAVRQGRPADALAAWTRAWRNGRPSDLVLRERAALAPGDDRVKRQLQHWRRYRTDETSADAALALATIAGEEALPRHAWCWLRRALEAGAALHRVRDRARAIDTERSWPEDRGALLRTLRDLEGA